MFPRHPTTRRKIGSEKGFRLVSELLSVPGGEHKKKRRKKWTGETTPRDGKVQRVERVKTLKNAVRGSAFRRGKGVSWGG